MNITVEVGIMIIVQILTIGIFVGQLKGVKGLFSYRLDKLEDTYSTLNEIKLQMQMLKDDIINLHKSIGALESKQDKHNQVVERVYKLENDVHTAFGLIDKVCK